MAGEQVSETVLRELYQGDPAEFVAGRDRLVEQARKAGGEALAAAIKALRKPTTAAWAVNRVSAEQRGRITELIEVGDELRAAQRELRGDEIRRLDRRRAELVRDLTEQAAEVVSRTGKGLGEQARRQVESTFAAAVAEPESGRLVQAGTLSGALAYSGFGLDEVSVAAMRSTTSRKRAHDSDARRGGRNRPHAEAGRGAGTSASTRRPGDADAEGVAPPADRKTGGSTRRAHGSDRTVRDTAGTTRKPREHAAGAREAEPAARRPAGRASPRRARETGKEGGEPELPVRSEGGGRTNRGKSDASEHPTEPAGRAKTTDEHAAQPDTGSAHRRSPRSVPDSGPDEAAELLRQAEDELRAAEQERDDQERHRDELRARLDDLSARLRDTTRKVTRARRHRDTARRRYDALRQRR